MFTTFKSLSAGEFLYKSGDPGGDFFFVLSGTLELLVKTGDDFKYSKGIDESTFFGQKKFHNEPRGDYARVQTTKLDVIIFQTKQYNEIVSKTQLSTSEKKVEFLCRYVPKFRQLQRRQIEDFEVFFVKESVTKGYVVQKSDEQGDYIYFVYRGTGKILYPTERHPDIFVNSGIFNSVKQKYLVLGHLN